MSESERAIPKSTDGRKVTEYPIVTIPKAKFHQFLKDGNSLREIFDDIRTESSRQGLDYSPSLNISTWFNDMGDFCLQNFAAEERDRRTRPVRFGH